MDVYLLSVNKNIHSTFQPTYTQGAHVECTLKNGCDVINPVIVIQSSMTSYANLMGYNYAVIIWSTTVTRYYYVDDFTFKNALLEIALHEDFLATWKTAIVGSSQYVLRAYSNYDGSITDTKYPLKSAEPQVIVPTGGYRENPLQPASTAYGVYIVGVVNKVGSVAGCVEYYAMSYLVFMTFCQQLFTLSNIWGSDTSVVDGIKKAITDPFQYVVSCIWLPYSVNDFVNRNYVDANGSQTVYLGYESIALGLTCYPFSNSVLNVEFTNLLSITTPVHPLSTSRGVYMNREPYTRYFCSFYPFCGLMELDGSRLRGTTYFMYTVDLRTGKGILNICSDYSGSGAADWKPSQIIQSVEAQVGVPIPIAAIQTALPNTIGEFLMNAALSGASQFGGFTQMINALTTDASTDIRGLTGGEAPPAGTSAYKAYERAQASGKVTTVESGKSAFADDIAKIATGALSMKSSLSLVGSQGTISMNSRNPFAFWALCYTPADENITRFGRPLCRVVALNTLSGFVLCDTPRMTIPYALETEVATVENLLATGIYIT